MLRFILTASTSALVIVGAKFLKKIDVVLCNARVRFFSSTISTSLTESAFSSPLLFFSLFSKGLSFTALGDLELSFLCGDLSGVLDLDLDLDLRRLVDSPSSSELDEDELDDEELDDEPGGAVRDNIENFAI